jgi:short-subunit dehydrogenase
MLLFAYLCDAGAWQVGVLVNNVGLSYDHAEYLDALDDQLVDDLININIQATNKVCFGFPPRAQQP